MEIEIRDITPEEAAPYGENADIAEGNSHRL